MKNDGTIKYLKLFFIFPAYWLWCYLLFLIKCSHHMRTVIHRLLSFLTTFIYFFDSLREGLFLIQFDVWMCLFIYFANVPLAFNIHITPLYVVRDANLNMRLQWTMNEHQFGGKHSTYLPGVILRCTFNQVNKRYEHAASNKMRNGFSNGLEFGAR